MISTSPLIEGGLNYYTCVTLIDITKTDAVRHYDKGMFEKESEYEILRNQHRNWQTIIQVISLRTQPMYLSEPVMTVGQELDDFGTVFDKGTYWTFQFGVEGEDIFDLPTQPGKVLLDDLHNVPVVVNLTEDVIIKPAIIDTLNVDTKNTLILK
jgi:hypothetical protein